MARYGPLFCGFPNTPWIYSKQTCEEIKDEKMPPRKIRGNEENDGTFRNIPEASCTCRLSKISLLHRTVAHRRSHAPKSPILARRKTIPWKSRATVSRLRESRVSVIEKPASGRREEVSEFRICLRRLEEKKVRLCSCLLFAWVACEKKGTLTRA